MKVTVFGLGYVGCVTAALLAKDGHQVIGVDVSTYKVDQLNRGESPVIEPGLSDVVSEMVKSGALQATLSVTEGLENSDISLICVGTPSANDGSLDLRFVAQVAQEIGENLAIASPMHTIVVRSTVLPGSTRKTVIPAIEKVTGKKIGDGFEVCTNPEFLREGSSLADYYDPPRILVGERAPGVGRIVHELYSKVEATRYSVPYEVAEAVKYTDNAFHALKVTFANEVGRVWEPYGADAKEVMKIVSEDKKLNISPVYLKPGFAFGGSCLPKDLRALCYVASSGHVQVPVLENLIASNEKHISKALERIKASGLRKIALIGLAFKNDTDDLRESPYVTLAKALIGEGYELRIYDPVVHVSRLNGSNKDYMVTELPHISKILFDNIDTVTTDADMLIVGHSLPDEFDTEEWEQDAKSILYLS